MNNKKLAFKGALLIDGTGKAPVKDSLVLVDDKTITYAGPAAGVAVETYHVINITDKVIMPGLIDCHVHLGGTASPKALDWVVENDRFQAVASVAQAKSLLEHGFTSARDISRNGLYLKKAINEGLIPGPRIVACGPGLSRRGGHGDHYELPLDLVNRSHPWAVIADGVDEVRRTVRSLLRDGSDCIKVWATGGGLWDRDRETDQHYSFEELKMMVEEAKYYGFGVCAHCESLEATKAALKAGVISIEHGEELDEECIEIMKKNDVTMVPTLGLFFEWFSEYEPPYRPVLDNFPGETLAEKELNRIIANFKAVKNAGVRIAVGADSFCSSMTPYGSYTLKEVRALVKAGSTEMEALVSATKSGAELLGFDDITGTLEKGKFADLLILSKNPLNDIENLIKENISAILKEGETITAIGDLVEIL